MKSLKKHAFLTAVFSALLITGAIAQCSSETKTSTTSETSTEIHNATASTESYVHTAATDIVDLAASQDNLSTLVTAVKAAGLVEVLKGEGPFTVFAPSNEAFARLPKATLESLLRPENKHMLVKVLTYHVVSGKAASTDIKDGQRVKSVEGSSIFVTKRDGGVMIDNAKVILANVEASNGIVHVIDRVILPPELK